MNPSQESNYAIYLSYAKGVEKADSVMATYCKMYYIEKILGQKRQTHSVMVAKEESSVINAVLKEIEQAQRTTRLSREQKQQRVEQYCLKMHEMVMKKAAEPGASRAECADQLRTVSDFIDVLTVFGPLEPRWVELSIASP